jgi:hypothetical protein
VFTSVAVAAMAHHPPSLALGPRQLVGEISRRRCMGKHLAFATIRHNAAAAELGAAAAAARAGGSDASATTAVTFASGCFADEGSPGWGGTAFPARKSQLRLGDRVRLTVQAGSELGERGAGFALVVLGWCAAGAGGGREAGRLAPDAGGGAGRRLPPAERHLGGGGGGDEQRRLVPVAGDEGAGGLCGSWALLGCCGCGGGGGGGGGGGTMPGGGGGCGWRHSFASAAEKGYVQKVRARRGQANAEAEIARVAARADGRLGRDPWCLARLTQGASAGASKQRRWQRPGAAAGIHSWGVAPKGRRGEVMAVRLQPNKRHRPAQPTTALAPLRAINSVCSPLRSGCWACTGWRTSAEGRACWTWPEGAGCCEPGVFILYAVHFD